MYVHLRGDHFPQRLLDEIGALTDKGTVRPEHLTYDRGAHLVRVSFIRYPIKKAGRIQRYTYDKTKPIACVAVIRDVIECTIQDNTDGAMHEVTLLFGIGFKGKTGCISSVEEDHGTPCFLVELLVDTINIELCDSKTSVAP